MAKKYIGYGNLFCPHCGDRRERGVRVCPKCGKNYSVKISMKGVPALGAAGIGWTPYAHDKSLKRFVKREKKGILISMAVISCIIAFAIIATTPGRLAAIAEGSWVIVLGPLAIIWTFWFVWYRLQYRKVKGWEGEVTDKRVEEVDEKRRDDEGNRWTEHKTYYKVYFRDVRGREHQLTQQDTSAWYDYLTVGDRVRYHGKYTSYYEPYDKSRVDYIPCAGCGTRQDSRATYCTDCGSRLFKAESAAPVTPPELEPAPAPAPSQNARYCENCGAKLGAHAKFCESCGAKVL